MVKIAVIGCGAIAQRHIPAVMASPECELSLLVDSNPETLERLKKKTGDIPSASDFEAHASEYDAAVVALPHHLHEPVTVKLLEMGKHVLIEKPSRSVPRNVTGSIKPLAIRPRRCLSA